GHGDTVAWQRLAAHRVACRPDRYRSPLTGRRLQLGAQSVEPRVTGDLRRAPVPGDRDPIEPARVVELEGRGGGVAPPAAGRPRRRRADANGRRRGADEQRAPGNEVAGRLSAPAVEIRGGCLGHARNAAPPTAVRSSFGPARYGPTCADECLRRPCRGRNQIVDSSERRRVWSLPAALSRFTS